MAHLVVEYEFNPPLSDEALQQATSLLAPCLVAYTIARPGWRRLVLAGGAAALGFAAMTLSTAMNFGPDHAFAWRTPSRCHSAIGFSGERSTVRSARPAGTRTRRPHRSPVRQPTCRR